MLVIRNCKAKAMADLQKVAFGGEEIQYDKLPGLGSRFALGSRDVQKFVHVPFNVAALDTKPAGPALEDITAGSVQGSDAIETEVISLSCSRSQCHSQLSPLNTPYRPRHKRSQSLHQKNMFCPVAAQRQSQAQ